MKMKKWKRSIAVLVCLFLAVGTFVGCGNSDGKTEDADAYADYPEKSIEIIVPYAAGGGTDVMARAVTKYLGLDQPAVVTNIEGGSSAIGTMEAYNRKPDGYTILCAMPEALMAYHLGGVLKVPAHEDLEMIATVVYDGNVVSVAKNSKFKSIEDVIAYAKENPGKLNWASVGAKSSNEQASAEFWKAAGIEVNYVPYDSASKSRVAVMGGHADVLFGQISEIKAVADSGDLIPLAVSTAERSKFFPDTPTFKELGYNIQNGLHRGFMAPKGTPKEIIKKLEAALKEVSENPEFIKLLEENLGYQAQFVGADDLDVYIKERWPIQKSLYQLIAE